MSPQSLTPLPFEAPPSPETHPSPEHLCRAHLSELRDIPLVVATGAIPVYWHGLDGGLHEASRAALAGRHMPAAAGLHCHSLGQTDYYIVLQAAQAHRLDIQRVQQLTKTLRALRNEHQARAEACAHRLRRAIEQERLDHPPHLATSRAPDWAQRTTRHSYAAAAVTGSPGHDLHAGEHPV